jgi:hypothetical protein
MRKIERAKLVVLLVFAAGFLAFLLSERGATRIVSAHSAGPPPGSTAAPGEPAEACAVCHTPQARSNGQMLISAPQTYVPGQTYQITVRHVNQDSTRKRWGFQLTALADDNTRAGNLQSLDSNTQVIDNAGPNNSRQYIEHTSQGTFWGQPNGAVWTFDWTAPSTSAGFVTFYAAGNQANGDGNSSGDYILTTFVGARPAATGGDFSLAANTSSTGAVSQGNSLNYNVVATPSGGFTGQIALSVASLPSGATSVFSPPALNVSDSSSQSSLLTVTAGNNSPPGTYTLTITAASGSVQHTASVYLTVYSTGANPIDDARFFVRQHYLDFLSREPDQAGLDYWSSQLTRCGSDPACVHSQRIAVSAAYFISVEFQQTGAYVYHFYKGSLGRQPGFAEFGLDRSGVVGGQNLDASKTAFAEGWVQRQEFVQKYPTSLANDKFVDALLATMKGGDGVDLTGQRSTYINALDSGSTRGQVVRQIVEDPAFVTAEYNPSFVLMQYFGYLRRDPDQQGYQFWLNILNNKLPNDSSGFQAMVCAFITSAEYQLRFASAVTHGNGECR